MAARKKKKKTQDVEVIVRPEMGVIEMDAAFADDIGGGHEEVGGQDLATPFLNILQPLSPACDKRSDDYVEGAEAGMFMHSINQRIFPADKDEGHEGIIVIPCHFQSRWIEWVPRSQGGGFVRQYDRNEAPLGARRGDIMMYMDEQGRPWDGPTNDAPRQAVYTHLHYMLLITNEGFEPFILSASGTGLTPGNKWNAEMRAMIPRGQAGPLPRYATAWRLHTKYRQNDKGSWFSWVYEVVRRLEPSEDENDALLVVAAREFKKAVEEQIIEVDMGAARATDEQPAPPSMNPSPALEDDIPF